MITTDYLVQQVTAAEQGKNFDRIRADELDTPAAIDAVRNALLDLPEKDAARVASQVLSAPDARCIISQSIAPKLVRDFGGADGVVTLSDTVRQNGRVRDDLQGLTPTARSLVLSPTLGARVAGREVPEHSDVFARAMAVYMNYKTPSQDAACMIARLAEMAATPDEQVAVRDQARRLYYATTNQEIEARTALAMALVATTDDERAQARSLATKIGQNDCFPVRLAVVLTTNDSDAAREQLVKDLVNTPDQGSWWIRNDHLHLATIAAKTDEQRHMIFGAIMASAQTNTDERYLIDAARTAHTDGDSRQVRDEAVRIYHELRPGQSQSRSHDEQLFAAQAARSALGAMALTEPELETRRDLARLATWMSERMTDQPWAVFSALEAADVATREPARSNVFQTKG